MKKKSVKKPSKVKEIYDQMQADRKDDCGKPGWPGKQQKGSKTGKFNSQPKSVAKKYWRQ